jgi:hypothetical protein
MVDDQKKLGEAFDRIAGRIESHMKRFYLLSYCTPARAGEHEVRIVAKTQSSSGNDSKGEAEWGVGENVDPPKDDEKKKKKKKKDKKDKNLSGSLEYTFDAEGFGPPPKCDPERKPQFKLEAPSDPDDEDADKREAKAEAEAG